MPVAFLCSLRPSPHVPWSPVSNVPPLTWPPCSLVSCDLPVASLAVSSAGIGRTGCFIATRIGCQQLKTRGEVDILGIVCQLRLDRWVCG